MSSKYVKQNRSRKGARTELINLWKIAAAVARPMGMTWYSYSPKAVLKALDPVATRMLENPDWTSNLVKILADGSLAMIWRVNGMGYSSSMILRLRYR